MGTLKMASQLHHALSYGLSERLAKVFQEELDTYVKEKIIPAFVEALDLDIQDLDKVYKELAQRAPETFGASAKVPTKSPTRAPAKPKGTPKGPPKASAKDPGPLNTQSATSDNISEPSDSSSEYTEGQLLKFKIAELKVICDKLRISKSGIKATLIENILKAQNKIIKTTEAKVKQSFSCIKPIEIQIEKDDLGNLVFEDMVFIESYADQAEKDYIVVGYKVDGKIKNLTSEKIDRCHELGIRYNDLCNINDPRETVILQKDEYGKICFQDLVYDSNTTEVDGTSIRYVIGYKDEEGTIHPLDAAHKEKCKHLGQHVR